MGRDSDATGGPAGGSASDSQGSQAGSQGAHGRGGSGGWGHSNPFGGSLSGPSRGTGGSGSAARRAAAARAAAAKKKAEEERRRQITILTDRVQFQAMLARNRQRAQAARNERQRAAAAKYGEQYAGYAGLDPNQVAEMRTDPALRGLDPSQAASAMAAATGAMSAPEDIAANVAAQTYGMRRGANTPADVAAAANAAIAEDRSFLGNLRDVAFDFDRTITPEIAEKYAMAQPDFTQAPSYTAGLPDVTSAYSSGLAYTDPAGQISQDAYGQAAEVFGSLAGVLAGAGLIGVGSALGGMPGAASQAMGRQAMASELQPDLNLGVASQAFQGDLVGALAAAHPIGGIMQGAQRVGEVNRALGIGPNRAQREATVQTARNVQDRDKGGRRSDRSSERKSTRERSTSRPAPDYRDLQQFVDFAMNQGGPTFGTLYDPYAPLYRTQLI